MMRRFESNGYPPRKKPRMGMGMGMGMNGNLAPNCEPKFFMNMSPMAPPPPPPQPVHMHCGDLRENHHGMFVEMDGKVNRNRLGRFIELKDQYGVIQLVAPIENISVSKRFMNMPLNSFITIVGQVKRRPDNLKNFSMPTGGVEVHVDNIIRVQRIFSRDSMSNGSLSNSRWFGTMVQSKGGSDDNMQNIVTAITSSECKFVNNNDTLVQWFVNREHTCDSLRRNDAGKHVTLVGWVDRKPYKFVHLTDGYGSTQVLIETDATKSILANVKDGDLVSVYGRVLARDPAHITHNKSTGEIELYAERLAILSPDVPSEEDASSSKVLEAEVKAKENEANVNEYTCRTHNCGELRETDIGKEVTLCGWLEYSRMNKFFTLRDAYGHTQVIVPKEMPNRIPLDGLHFETVLKVTGRVIARPPKMVNPNMSTGMIEIEMISYELLNKARPDFPVKVREFNVANETLRMKYRYINLRMPDIQHNLRMRSNVLMRMREYLINTGGFVEIETPTLFRRTPGGAQEFIVPTQTPGQFYSLVQSPQQFKQMLMAGCVDRYFQIARCYRDESTAVDRQPEFTQLDIELSFTDSDKIIALVENILQYSWPKELGSLPATFNRISYDEAMDRYGSDKPDMRYKDLQMENVTDLVETVGEQQTDYHHRTYIIPLQEKFASSFTNQIEDSLKSIAVDKKHVQFISTRLSDDWATKCGLTEASANAISDKFNLEKSDVILFAQGAKTDVQTILGKIRKKLISAYVDNECIPAASADQFEFLWVLDFPLFAMNEQTGELESAHHPFTAPNSNDLHRLDDPTTVDQCKSLAYDLVLNGQEIGGGSIRIHDAALQKRILNDILKIDSSHLAHLLEALQSGCPPHGGIALGLDRLLSIMCRTKSIRDVIAFPKGAKGRDPLSNSPCEVSKEELELYHLTIQK